MEYILLGETDSTRLAIDVTEKLKEGWKLYGSPFGITPVSEWGNYSFHQALIKEGDNDVK
jgi:hypothetical protein